jgi:hypothetical protein
VIVAGTALVACGSAPPPPRAGDSPLGPRFTHDVDPGDLFPGDLDLVVRVDVGRMRAGIGPAVADALAKRALQETAGEEIRAALACAEVVWIATRAGDLDGGDRVIVVEGQSCMPDIAAARWERVHSANGKLRIFDRKMEAPRSGTARIMNLGNKASVFVSPVELDAVKRVLEEGPDPKRGAPSAEGLFSFDLRAGRLPPALEKKYPSIGAVLAGIERVRGSAALIDDGLKIDAQIRGASADGAERAARFLEAMRESLAQSPRFAALLKDVHVERVETAVQVRLTVPAKTLLAMMTGDASGPAPASNGGEKPGGVGGPSVGPPSPSAVDGVKHP